MLYNPNRYVVNTDDIYGVQRTDMMANIILPGTHSFYTNVAPIPVKTPVIWASDFIKDSTNPADWQPDTSDEVFN